MGRKKEAEKTDKIKSLEIFSGVIAHEFNNLLAGIQAWAQIGIKEKDEEVIKKAFKNINKACQRGTNLADSLLDFSRKNELSPVLVDINRLLDENIDLLVAQFDEKKIVIEKDYSPVSNILVDKDKIYQVFLNLLINAKDAIEGEGKITIKTGQKDNMVEISLSDNGKGIKKEHIKHIFTPFYSTKNNGGKNETFGRGLGLAIAKDIIRRHRGDIKVESTVGEGTTFHIYLPLGQPVFLGKKDKKG